MIKMKCTTRTFEEQPKTLEEVLKDEIIKFGREKVSPAIEIFDSFDSMDREEKYLLTRKFVKKYNCDPRIIMAVLPAAELENFGNPTLIEQRLEAILTDILTVNKPRIDIESFEYFLQEVVKQ